jgi:hypothetical protein
MKIVTDRSGPPRNPYDRAAWELEAEYGDSAAAVQAGDSYLVEYIEKCRSGEILVGRELLAQLDMLAADMITLPIGLTIRRPTAAYGSSKTSASTALARSPGNRFCCNCTKRL